MKNKGVLVLYTGGTIGSMPADPNDPESPQRVVDWHKFLEMTPQIDPENLRKIPDHIGFNIDAWSLQEALDSCNVTPKDWIAMAECIATNIDKYEGFVVVHGTDTMVYTASALSFMLKNLQKPVIVTGAQRSHTFMPRNDGLQNLLTSLEFANPSASGIPVIPEVCIFFGGTLLRGNRSRKYDSEGYVAYHTPNYPELGHAGAGKLTVNERNILPVPTQPLQLRKKLNTNVVSFPVFPGIQDGGFVERIIDVTDLKGVVLHSFGSGNIPTNKDFLSVFEKAHKQGVVIQNCTQCLKGSVALGIYETSAALLEIGMVTGFDATPESLVCKQMALLGDEDLSSEEVAQLSQQSLAGEMSSSVFEQQLKTTGALRLDEKSKRKRLPPNNAIEGNWTGQKISNATLRLYAAEITCEEGSGPLQFDVYLNLGSDDPLSCASPNFAGSFKRGNSKGKFIVSFDITDCAKRLINSGDRISATVHLANGKGSVTWQKSEIAVFINELS